MLLYTAREDSYLLLLGITMGKVSLPLLFLSFFCQNILYLTKSSLRGAFRGYCCAVMATKLNSLFQVFTKYQDCHKWFAVMVLIVLFS